MTIVEPGAVILARRRFFRACAIGGLLAALVFGWLLSAGRADLLQSHELDNLYDAQAHSLLDGHWDIPREQLGIEAFIVDGKAYMYYGPVPAVLRMPVAALTDRFDGRLTQLSMLAAFAVLIVFTARLAWRVRVLVRGERPVGRGESWATGALVFIVGAGSVALFLASRTIVYHEAELWGAALAVAAYDSLVGFVVRPTRRALAGAAVFGGLAFLTRPSVGAGPLVALGLVLLGRLLVGAFRRVRRRGILAPLRWLGLGDEQANRSYLLPILLALVVPVALYMYVNHARFGHPWHFPATRHITVLEGFDRMRIEALAANDNSLFGLKFLPTNAVVMLRPDGISFNALFPWVSFPPLADVLAGVKFDTIDHAASVPSTMPLLFVLSLVGLVAVFRPRRQPPTEPGLEAIRTPVLGAFVGGAITLTIAFVAHRYLSDFLPVLILLGLAGTFVLLRAAAESSRRRALVVAFAGVLGVLGVLSMWANFGLGLQYQRAYNVFLSESERAAFIGFQREVDERLPGGSRVDVNTGDELPEQAAAGTLFVLGECDGLYWSDGKRWYGVDRTNATGRFSLRISFPDRPTGTRETLMAVGTGDHVDRVGVEYRDGDRIVFTYESAVYDLTLKSDVFDVETDRPYRADLVSDERVGQLTVDLDGESAFDFNSLLATGPITTAGGDAKPSGPQFSGTVEQLPPSPALCRDLVSAARS